MVSHSRNSCATVELPGRPSQGYLLPPAVRGPGSGTKPPGAADRETVATALDPTDRLRRIAAWEARLSAPDFTIGSWVLDDTDRGVQHMPWSR